MPCSEHSMIQLICKTVHAYHFIKHEFNSCPEIQKTRNAHCSKLEIVLNKNDTPKNQQFLLTYTLVAKRVKITKICQYPRLKTAN